MKPRRLYKNDTLTCKIGYKNDKYTLIEFDEDELSIYIALALKEYFEKNITAK